MKWCDYFLFRCKTSLFPRPFLSSLGMRLMKIVFFLLVDLFGMEEGGRRKEGAHHYFVFLQINWEIYKKTLRRTVFNALVTSLFFQLSIHPLVRWRGINCGYELPSFPTALWHLFLHLVIVEIGFYYTHRSALLRFFNSDYSKVMVLLYFALCHGYTMQLSLTSMYFISCRITRHA